jgi:hypothetical protein
MTASTDDDLEAELAEVTDELYGLDPGEFTPARNELVRRLRMAGNRQLAARVAALRRPSPAAWAVNQLARHQRADVDDLLRLGDVLRTAQSHVLAGADPSDLRRAARARRDAVARLADAAIGLLDQRRSGAAAHRDEVTATLETASLDPQAGVDVSRGRLATGLSPPSGFGDLGDDEAWGMADVPPATSEPQAHAAAGTQGDAPSAPTAAPIEIPPEAAPDDLTRELITATRAVADAGRSATALVAAARDAVEAAANSEREADDAEADLMRRQRALEDARAGVEERHRHADEARRAATSAEAAATEAVEHLRRAEQHVDDLRARSGPP